MAKKEATPESIMKRRREAFEMLGDSTSRIIAQMCDLAAIQRRRDLLDGVAPSEPPEVSEVAWELFVPDGARQSRNGKRPNEALP